MVAAPQFYNLLEILGGIDIELLQETKNWNYYGVKFRTPAGELNATYLYLASDCPLNEASPRNLTTWKSNGLYTVVATTKSRLAQNLERTADIFGARGATTPRRMLIDNVLQSVNAPLKVADEFRYFIEPEISYADTNTSERRSAEALTYFVDLLVNTNQERIDSICGEILVAPAGQGKTTLCRAIANKIRSSRPDTIPVLVESNQWQRLIELTLPNVLNAALLQMLPGATHLTNPKVFQLLIREQILVPIFDGFDELSLHPSATFSAFSLLSELLDLVGDADAKVLVTVRETFWENHLTGSYDANGQRLRRHDLQGFSNQQRKRFFQKRLKKAEERDVASRLSGEIGKRLYEGAIDRPEMQRDRADGIPLMLELIALYVEDNTKATPFPLSQDPLGHLLEAICEREDVRQKLDINSQKQMLIFENIFRDYAEEIPKEYLALYVEEFAPEVTQDTISRFESHALLSTVGPAGLIPRFETLRVYFVARWLANQLEGTVEKDISSAATELLSMHAAGSSDIFDHLVDRFAGDPKEKTQACIFHAVRMVRARANWEGASSAIFHLCQRLAHLYEKERRARARIVLEFVSGQSRRNDEVNNIAVHGQINGLDLSGFTFARCEFKNLEFYNCSFDDRTVFSNCRFVGGLSFSNCSNANAAILDECRLSDTALLSWEERKNRNPRRLLTERNARLAIRDILRKFENRFGFSSIKVSDRDAGPISRNPCKDRAWNALTNNGIIVHHKISGVSEGGINIVEDSDVRHEVRNFLDNAALGRRLKRALDQILA